MESWGELDRGKVYTNLIHVSLRVRPVGQVYLEVHEKTGLLATLIDGLIKEEGGKDKKKSPS